MTDPRSARPVRIANCSGFYGDRLSALHEQVTGGDVDVVTGDYLAELTMLILSRTRAKRPGGGFARTFVGQMEEVMGTCLDRGIKVVSNAGGLGMLGGRPGVKAMDACDLLVMAVGIRPNVKLAQDAGLALLFHLAPDELFDVGVVHVEEHRLVALDDEGSAAGCRHHTSVT